MAADPVDETYPATPALDAWHEAHPHGHGTDHTRVRLWFPHEGPDVLLDTIDHGCQKAPTLHDPERPTCNVRLGSTIHVGGYLSDMEAYFAAVIDAIKVARWQADTIAREMAAEAPVVGEGNDAR